MTKKSAPAHVVVDGSNIATEGRSMPSLAQLNEAVMGYMAENPGTLVTVVVDATFGHRIAKKESKEFEAGISNNELVAPPAGAVGRGDAFVLGIADKAEAIVLSNDSFQEFHGQYAWLFDEGRLVGGKPVPHVGWVFVARVPVRGPVSRQATRSTKSSRSGAGSRSPKVSKAASDPMPVPNEPPPRAKAPRKAPAAATPASPRQAVPRADESVNELMPFLEFVEHHPVGTSVNGTVDAYSSHGAYVSIGDQGVRAYVPLRLMSDPPPRSARKALSLGESTTLVVVSFVPERRSIDCALPDMAEAEISMTSAGREAGSVPAKRKERRQPDGDQSDTGGTPQGSSEGGPAVEAAEVPAKKSASKKTTARKRAPKKTAAKKTATAKKTVAKKPAAKKTSAAKKSTAVKKTAAKKTSAAKKAPAKKAPAKKAPARKTGARKTAAKKATGSTAGKKSVARKTRGAQPTGDDAASQSQPPADSTGNGTGHSPGSRS